MRQKIGPTLQLFIQPSLHLVAGEGVWGRGRRVSPRRLLQSPRMEAVTSKNGPGGDAQCCRLLVGMQRLPEDQLRTALSLIKSDEAIDNQTAVRLKDKLAREFRDQLAVGIPTNEEEQGLRRVEEGRLLLLSPFEKKHRRALKESWLPSVARQGRLVLRHSIREPSDRESTTELGRRRNRFVMNVVNYFLPFGE